MSVLLHTGDTAAPGADESLLDAHARLVAELDVERRMIEDRIDFPVPHQDAAAPWGGAHALRCAALVEALLAVVLLASSTPTGATAALRLTDRLLLLVPVAVALGGLVVLAVNAVLMPRRNAHLDEVNERIDEHNAQVRSDNRRLMVELRRINTLLADLEEALGQEQASPAPTSCRG